MRKSRMLVLVGGLLIVVLSVAGREAQAGQSPYFPMTLGSEWVYEKYSNIRDTVLGQDTVRIDGVRWVRGQTYFHLSTEWFPIFSCWVRADERGDLYWCEKPGGVETPLLLFSSENWEMWSTEHLAMPDEMCTVPCGEWSPISRGFSSDFVCVGGSCVPPCYDVRWWGSFARDVGPVQWDLIGAGLATIEFRLLEYNPGPAGACRCHGDPVCDGLTDVRDVTSVVDMAFRGVPPTRTQGCSWYARTLHGASDVDCSGETNIIDVVLLVDVALRGADASLRFCRPW